jgi:hypothetical protein
VNTRGRVFHQATEGFLAPEIGVGVKSAGAFEQLGQRGAVRRHHTVGVQETAFRLERANSSQHGRVVTAIDGNKMAGAR